MILFGLDSTESRVWEREIERIEGKKYPPASELKIRPIDPFVGDGDGIGIE